MKILEISNNDIGDDAIEEIAAGLRENKTLQELWLTGNPLTEQATLSVVQSVKENTTIEVLWLPHCNSKEAIDEVEMEKQNINDYRRSKQCFVQLKLGFILGNNYYREL